MNSITFSDIMEFYPEHNYSVYEELKGDIQQGCLIPFVGAGLSVFCGYKCWPDVLNELAKYIYDRDIRNNIEILIKKGELLQAAQDIQDNYPRMLKILRKVIDYDNIKKCDNDKLYASATFVLPYLFNNNFVITTNFDRVLEEVYDKCHTKFENIITPYDSDLLTQSRQRNPHCLFKLHGDIGPNVYDIKRLVFTQTQYSEAYADDGPLMQELPQWFQNKKLLFLGCSLAKDKTMDVLQQVITKNPGLDHYAILNCASDNIQKKCIEMENLGISAIYYPDEKYEAVRIILERLLEDTNHTAYEELHYYTKKSTPASRAIRRFMYDSDYIAFVGRKKELVQLQEFCHDSRQVSWWAVTGPGGIGKSRLVYEFSNRQKAVGWKVFWLSYNDYDNLPYWIPPSDCCIVVADDAQKYFQALGNWIISMSTHLRSEKLRILLLERDGKNLISANWVEMLQSDSPYDNTIATNCYCSDFLNLDSMADDELKTIMIDFAKASAKSPLQNEYVDCLLQTLKKIDSNLQRPIYAMAIVDAWCNGKNPISWNKEQVLDALINHELKFYYNRLRGLSTDRISKKMCFELESLLANSCLYPCLPLKEIDIVDNMYPALCERANKLDMTLHELLQQIGVLHKIGESKNQFGQNIIIKAAVLDCPDLVKEYFVLRQAFDKGQIELLFPKNWDNNPVYLCVIANLFFDYPEKFEENSQAWNPFFAGNPKSFASAYFYGTALFTATLKFPKVTTQALVPLEKLHEQFPTYELFATWYANVLALLDEGQILENIVYRVDKLRLLHEQFPQNEELTVYYAFGLLRLTIKQTLNERLHSVNEMKFLFEQFPMSEDLAVVYAYGLANLSSVQTSEVDIDETIKQLKKLFIQYPQNLNIQALSAKLCK